MANDIRIASIEENPNGLHGRYIVTKASGEPVDERAIYFVLRLDQHGDDYADRAQADGGRSGGRGRPVRDDRQRHYRDHDLSHAGHRVSGTVAVTRVTGGLRLRPVPQRTLSCRS